MTCYICRAQAAWVRQAMTGLVMQHQSMKGALVSAKAQSCSVELDRGGGTCMLAPDAG